MTSTVLRNAVIVDGTGSAAREGDVLFRAGRIVEVGAVEVPVGAEVIDLDGLVLAPGFIDLHTHYDAQILWDPDLTPSSSYGVTSVIAGNCGFGIAPTSHTGRNDIIETLGRVEDLPVDVLRARIDWDFETFAEYRASVVSKRPRLNFGAFVGHTPVRTYVLGGEATERTATADEIQRMAAVVAAAMEDGAMGFASSVSSFHYGAGGKPVPSRMADDAELFALAEALRPAGRGVVMIAGPGPSISFAEYAHLASVSGRPVTWTAIHAAPVGRPSATLMLDRQDAYDQPVWPQVSCRPMVSQMSLLEPLPLYPLASFAPVLRAEPEDRARVYADPHWRDVARPEVERSWSTRWDRIVLDETSLHAADRGATIAALARRDGVHPFDLLLDLGLAEDLRTRFKVVLMNDNEEDLELLLRDERTLLGLADSGAHLAQLCDACFAPFLLEHWVRERGALTIEQAVWRLTGHPAAVLGLRDRGRLAPGMAADLTAFDAATVGVEQPVRETDAGGLERLLAPCAGIEHVWVNGEPIRRDGIDLPGCRPGQWLRPS